MPEAFTYVEDFDDYIVDLSNRPRIPDLSLDEWGRLLEEDKIDFSLQELLATLIYVKEVDNLGQAYALSERHGTYIYQLWHREHEDWNAIPSHDFFHWQYRGEDDYFPIQVLRRGDEVTVLIF